MDKLTDLEKLIICHALNFLVEEPFGGTRTWLEDTYGYNEVHRVIQKLYDMVETKEEVL